jgi:hypothetical protein
MRGLGCLDDDEPVKFARSDGVGNLSLGCNVRHVQVRTLPRIHNHGGVMRPLIPPSKI